MKKIQLANNKGVALVDDEDYDMLMQYKWHLSVNIYAEANIKINNKWTTKRMHKFLINTPNKMEVDHIDGNGLNNQKSNLRIVTTSQNQMNRKKQNGSSIYKGVYFDNNANKWCAQIYVNKKRIYLGLFINEKDAAIVYNEKAKELFGEFANLNEVKNGL